MVCDRMGAMKRLQAFRFALRPTDDQERTLRQFAGSCRYVYNRALGIEIARHKSGEKHLGYVGTANLLPGWKRDPETLWLTGVHSQILQQSLKDLDRAYQNFFEKRAGFPTFRKKGQNDSFRYPQGVKLDCPNARIFLPKVGWVTYRKSREVLGAIKNVTVRRSGDKWFVVIQTEREVAVPSHPSPGIVGIDLGVARFATLSDGTVILAPDLSGLEKQLKHAQKDLSRKKKGSRNREKARNRVRALHRKIADVRADFLHKTSTTICKSHAIVVLEDLRVGNMSRSAKGTVESPGKSVRAKSGLNRSILRQGWGEFRRQLDYKLAWNGGMLVVVSPAYTSQTCSECGHVSPENRETQSRFVCRSCGTIQNADLNAAKNILRAGHARSACGEAVRPAAPERRVRKAASAKQEPTEGRQRLLA